MTVPESELDEAGGVLWGANATGEFAFEDAYIKSVTYMNGTQSFTNPIVGKFFFFVYNNLANGKDT